MAGAPMPVDLVSSRAYPGPLDGDNVISSTVATGKSVDKSPLSSLSKGCVARFQRLCEFIRDISQEDAESNSYNRDEALVSMQDARSRFKAWAGNIAAFQDIRLKSSLDYRLKEAKDIRERILKVLSDLRESLDDALLIVTGAEENDTWGAFSDSEEGSNNPDETIEQTSQLEQLFKAIKSANSTLMKLSVVIRNSPNRDDYLKASMRYSYDPRYDIGHVKEKHWSQKKDNDWLIQRLGKAITRRRAFLKYREEHHGKLARDWDDVPEKDAELDEAHGTIALTKHTKATTFIESKPLVEKDGSEAGSFGSQTSYEQTVTGEGAEARLTVPPPPQWAFEDVPFEYGQPFRCPLCYTEQTVKNRAAWKKHVFRDLKPYVCTYQECNLRMFKSRNEWFAHEIQVHRREYTCQMCSKVFSQKGSFSKHILTDHNKRMEGSELEAIILQSEEPVDRIYASACLICDDWRATLEDPKQDSKRRFLNDGKEVEPYGTLAQFRRHLGRHMEQLALFALPKSDGNEMDDDSIDGGNDSDSNKSKNEGIFDEIRQSTLLNETVNNTGLQTSKRDEKEIEDDSIDSRDDSDSNGHMNEETFNDNPLPGNLPKKATRWLCCECQLHMNSLVIDQFCTNFSCNHARCASCQIEWTQGDGPAQPSGSPSASTKLDSSSSTREAHREMQIRSISEKLIPLLAVGPQTRTSIQKHGSWVNDEAVMYKALYQIADNYNSTSQWALKRNLFKSIDYWNTIPEDDRSRAIEHAIREFDRMRLSHDDPAWDLLLPVEERGKGVVLSRLQIKPIHEVAGNAKGTLGNNFSDNKGTESEKEEKQGEELDDYDDTISTGSGKGSYSMSRQKIVQPALSDLEDLDKPSQHFQTQSPVSENVQQGIAFDTAGQAAPAGKKAVAATTYWIDEGTLCYLVNVKGILVARRKDNNMINGTNLLNVAGLTRARGDSILGSERATHVIETGQPIFKGVWIPYDRALTLANKEGITPLLYPIFIDNIEDIFSQQTSKSDEAKSKDSPSHPPPPPPPLNIPPSRARRQLAARLALHSKQNAESNGDDVEKLRNLNAFATDEDDNSENEDGDFTIGDLEAEEEGKGHLPVATGLQNSDETVEHLSAQVLDSAKDEALNINEKKISMNVEKSVRSSYEPASTRPEDEEAFSFDNAGKKLTPAGELHQAMEEDAKASELQPSTSRYQPHDEDLGKDWQSLGADQGENRTVDELYQRYSHALQAAAKDEERLQNPIKWSLLQPLLSAMGVDVRTQSEAFWMQTVVDFRQKNVEKRSQDAADKPMNSSTLSANQDKAKEVRREYPCGWCDYVAIDSDERLYAHQLAEHRQEFDLEADSPQSVPPEQVESNSSSRRYLKRSDTGSDDENIAIKAAGQARVKVGEAQMDFNDEGEIRIERQKSLRSDNERSPSEDDGERHIDGRAPSDNVGDQESPLASTLENVYSDQHSDTLSKIRSQINSTRRRLMPLHIPPHVRDTRSRRLSEQAPVGNSGDFASGDKEAIKEAVADAIAAQQQSAQLGRTMRKTEGQMPRELTAHQIGADTEEALDEELLGRSGDSSRIPRTHSISSDLNRVTQIEPTQESRHLTVDSRTGRASALEESSHVEIITKKTKGKTKGKSKKLNIFDFGGPPPSTRGFDKIRDRDTASIEAVVGEGTSLPSMQTQIGTSSASSGTFYDAPRVDLTSSRLSKARERVNRTYDDQTARNNRMTDLFNQLDDKLPDKAGGNTAEPDSEILKEASHEEGSSHTSHTSHHKASPPENEPEDDFDYDFDYGDVPDDDAIIAAANAEALAYDSDGFYGQEFGFYSAPAGEAEHVSGGYLGPRGA